MATQFPDLNDSAAVAAWVEAEFARSGKTIATADESADARIARITAGLIDGTRQYNSVVSSIANLPEGRAGTADGLTEMLARFEKTYGVTWPDDISRWTDELINGTGRGRDLAQLERDIQAFKIDELNIKPIAQDIKGIMSGGTIHKVKNNAGQLDYYVVAYEYPPGSEHSFFYTFEDEATLKASVGDEWASMLGAEMFEHALAGWTNGGDSNEILGITGSFQGYIDDITLEAAQKAGLGDPTRLGDALKNPEIALIMAKSAEGGWEDAQTQAALRKTDYYKNVWYPGIENFYGRTDEPEAAYAMYKQNVTANLDSLGVARDGDGSYDSTIKKMLDAGVTDTAFASFTPTYQRAAGNDVYRQNVNKWLGAAGIAPLSDFDSFYDLLAGNAQPEIDEIVELAGISFVASEQGTQIGDEFIREIAERTDLSEAQIAQSFLQSDRDLLGVGEAGLRTAGLTAQDIIATATGFTTGERTLAQMQALIKKTKTEQGIADDPTATIFTDFNREGAPIKKGLQSTISEGA